MKFEEKKLSKEEQNKFISGFTNFCENNFEKFKKYSPSYPWIGLAIALAATAIILNSLIAYPLVFFMGLSGIKACEEIFDIRREEHNNKKEENKRK